MWHSEGWLFIDAYLHTLSWATGSDSSQLVGHSGASFRTKILNLVYIYIYIYAFSRRFYPKRLTVHSSYSFYILQQVRTAVPRLAHDANQTQGLLHCYKPKK